MLVTLLAWIFITFLCWAWGMLVLHRIKTFLKDDSFLFPHISIICMTGLAFVAVFAGILSLFMPLGSWTAHLIVVSPCLLLFFQKQNPSPFGQLKDQFKDLHPAMLFLLIGSLALVLIMCTWKINHPDTLGYHGQTIQWIEKYKAVPGLVHLNPRYGYQGLWFVTCAFFNLQFAGIDTLTLINSMVVVWYFFFIIQKINKCFSTGEKVNAILWLLLFAGSCLSYTQVRLTVTSASPDFITTLFLWLIFYLFLKKEAGSSNLHWLLIIVLSVFSITLKLSAAPVFLLMIYSAIQLWRLKKMKALIISFMLAAVILLPFLARNIVTSGYLLFPSAFPDVVSADWKLDPSQTRFEKNYITAYARTQVEYNEKEVEATIALPVNKWLPGWWKKHRHIDKIILLFLGFSFVAAIIRLNILVRSHPQTKAALITAITGTAFWFIQAPDPRFGFGFIIAFIATVLPLILSNLNLTAGLYKKMIILLVLMSGFAISSYSVYRLLNFFSSSQIIKPAGIENNLPSSFRCGEVIFYKPTGNDLCGDLPVPCIYTDSCNNLQLRGNKITDGFRAKSNDEVDSFPVP